MVSSGFEVEYDSLEGRGVAEEEPLVVSMIGTCMRDSDAPFAFPLLCPCPLAMACLFFRAFPLGFVTNRQMMYIYSDGQLEIRGWQWRHDE